MTSHVYLTTSIPYVNGAPHLGHALEFVQADALARHRRLRGDVVRLQTGTDDNSLKNVRAAEAAGIPVQEFVDAHADRFEALRDGLAFGFDDFIRTSRDARHRPGVEAFWRACDARGDLYRKEYEGLYCVGCERFYTPDELTAAGSCPEHGTEPELVREENWFFRLSRYRDALRDLYDEGRIRIEPQQRANEVRAFVERGLEDFSISRSVQRAHGWGVPVPGDPSQVMYVWWDALGNYVTALGYAGSSAANGEAYRIWWERSARRIHLIGKGILRFHAVYWPAMLLSAGLPLPTDIVVHDYVTVEGGKVGKSLGNAIDPEALLEAYGTDALRWWLLARVPKVGDTDFTVEGPDGLIATANRDLAGGLGNLVQRVTAMIRKYRGGFVPELEPTVAREVERPVAGLRGRIDRAFEAYDFRAAAAELLDAVASANRYVERTAPWALAKQESNSAESNSAESNSAESNGEASNAPETSEETYALNSTLRVLFDTCREIVEESTPFVPGLAAELCQRLSGSPLSTGDPVFPRLEPASDVR